MNKDDTMQVKCLAWSQWSQRKALFMVFVHFACEKHFSNFLFIMLDILVDTTVDTK